MNRLILLAVFGLATLSLAACRTRVEEGPAGVYHITHNKGGLVKLPLDYRITAPARTGPIPAEELKMESAFRIKDQPFSAKRVAGYLDRRGDGKVEIRLIQRVPDQGTWFQVPISGIHRVHPKSSGD